MLLIVFQQSAQFFPSFQKIPVESGIRPEILQLLFKEQLLTLKAHHRQDGLPPDFFVASEGLQTHIDFYLPSFQAFQFILKEHQIFCEISEFSFLLSDLFHLFILWKSEARALLLFYGFQLLKISADPQKFVFHFIEMNPVFQNADLLYLSSDLRLFFFQTRENPLTLGLPFMHGLRLLQGEVKL